MPQEDYELESKDQQNINTTTWQDLGNSQPNPNPTIQNNPNPNFTEKIPQLTEEEQTAQDKKRNSPEFQQGLKNILPQSDAPKTDKKESPENLNAMIQQWQKDIPQVTADDKNDTGLPDKLKVSVEAMSGISLNDVQVHYNSTEPAKLNALAYAKGNDIFVAPNQEKHLAHEAWHIVQQKQGKVQPTIQNKATTPTSPSG